jgi:hypothetical protein
MEEISHAFSKFSFQSYVTDTYWWSQWEMLYRYSKECWPDMHGDYFNWASRLTQSNVWIEKKISYLPPMEFWPNPRFKNCIRSPLRRRQRALLKCLNTWPKVKPPGFKLRLNTAIFKMHTTKWEINKFNHNTSIVYKIQLKDCIVVN